MNGQFDPSQPQNSLTRARVTVPQGGDQAETYEAALLGLSMIFASPEHTREELQESVQALLVAALDAATGTVTQDVSGRPIQPGPDRIRAVVQLELLRDPGQLKGMASLLRARGCEALAASLEGRAAQIQARRQSP